MTAQQPAVKKYIVKLSAEERNRLDVLIQKGKAPARQLLKARILLKADASTAGEAWSDSRIAATLDTSIDTTARTRQQLVEEGLDACLERKKQVRPSVERIFDGEKEAKLIAVACGPAPEGRARWTLELLAGRVVRLKIVDHCSTETVRRTLQKTS